MANYTYDGDYKYVVSGTNITSGSQVTTNISGGSSSVREITEKLYTQGGFFVSTARTSSTNIMSVLHGFSSKFTQYKFLITAIWRPSTGSGYYYAYVISRSATGSSVYTGATSYDNAAWINFSSAEDYFWNPFGCYNIYLPNTTLTNLKTISNVMLRFAVKDSAGNVIESTISFAGTTRGVLKPINPWLHVTYSPTRRVMFNHPNNYLNIPCRYGSIYSSQAIEADSVTITPKYLAAHSACTMSSAGTLAWGTTYQVQFEPTTSAGMSAITFPTDSSGRPMIVSDLTQTKTNTVNAQFGAGLMGSLIYEITATKANHIFYSDTACTASDFTIEKSVFTGGTPPSGYKRFTNTISKTIYAKPNSIVQKAYLVFTEYGDEYSDLSDGPMPSTVNTYGGDDRTTYLKFLSGLAITGSTGGNTMFVPLTGITGTTTGYTNTDANSVTVGAYQNTSHMFDGLHYYGAFARITFNSAPINAYAVTAYTAMPSFALVPIENEIDNLTFKQVYDTPDGSYSVPSSSFYLIKSGWTEPWEYVVTFPIRKKGVYTSGKIATYDYFCRKLCCMASPFFLGEWNSYADMVDSIQSTCDGYTGRDYRKTVCQNSTDEYDGSLRDLVGKIITEYDHDATPKGKIYSYDNIPFVAPGGYLFNQSIKTEDLLLEDN